MYRRHLVASIFVYTLETILAPVHSNDVGGPEYDEHALAISGIDHMPSYYHMEFRFSLSFGGAGETNS